MMRKKEKRGIMIDGTQNDANANDGLGCWDGWLRQLMGKAVMIRLIRRLMAWFCSVSYTLGRWSCELLIPRSRYQ